MRGKAKDELKVPDEGLGGAVELRVFRDRYGTVRVTRRSGAVVVEGAANERVAMDQARDALWPASSGVRPGPRLFGLEPDTLRAVEETAAARSLSPERFVVEAVERRLRSGG